MAYARVLALFEVESVFIPAHQTPPASTPAEAIRLEVAVRPLVGRLERGLITCYPTTTRGREGEVIAQDVYRLAFEDLQTSADRLAYVPVGRRSGDSVRHLLRPCDDRLPRSDAEAEAVALALMRHCLIRRIMQYEHNRAIQEMAEAMRSASD